VNILVYFKNKIIYLQFNLALYDTAGQEAYARLRPLSYTDTNIVLICFSVDSPTSYANVIEEWNPEVRHFCGRCPVILVACKIDLRTDQQTIERLKEQGEKLITTEVGKKLAAQIKADAYMECSAKTREGIHDLFIHAARLSLEKRSHYRPNRNCCLY
jgi:Ras family protein A